MRGFCRQELISRRPGMSGSLVDLIATVKTLQNRVQQLEQDSNNMTQRIRELQQRADAADAARQAVGDYYPIFNSTIWTVPPNVSKIRLDAYGAGGFGGDWASIPGRNGGAGTGGGYGSVIMNVTPGDAFNVTIPLVAKISTAGGRQLDTVVRYLNGSLTLLAIRGLDGNDGNHSTCAGCSWTLGPSSNVTGALASTVQFLSLAGGGAGPYDQPLGGKGAGPLGGAGGIYAGSGAFPGGGVALTDYRVGGAGAPGFVAFYRLN
eukprot:TRINITY_DN10644_c0_g1_i1.p1 TRINITY_DN10644_c0_g1~~TRINITY_DN10644_c0_g1_i1.p1  ORF type:complete len:263 (-),score=24.13 TRINITY_DN10644_c0_g1_i1:20-808(-)